MPLVSRRSLLSGFAAAPLISSAGILRANTDTSFAHGVASGDPEAHSIVLWTRVTTREETVRVRWELATKRDFSEVVQQGEVFTNSLLDHTVKVIPQGLEPGRTYYYRFRCDSAYSPVGRTRTLPVGAVPRLGIALVSCSNFAFGHFHAYQAIADDPAIDVVLHTGDYIYEYGANGWGSETSRALGRVHQPIHEIVTLADYRQRHAQYKSDSGSRAMHAAHPLIALWDDHESANNPWQGGAQNHQSESEGDWRSRRAAATQAYYEWMPIRPPRDDQSRIEFWRRYSFGDLATLVTLESRHTARAEQIDYGSVVAELSSATDAKTFESKVLNEPGRRMLSPRMESFLEQSLEASKAAQQPWRLLGNAIPMVEVRVPDLAAHGIAMPGGHVEGSADLAWKGKYDLPLYLDTWDGYPWARERLFDLCENVDVRDLLVLTGDSHSFWANSITRANGTAMGVEIGAAGVTSPGDFVEQGFDQAVAQRLDTLIAQHNEGVNWTDNLHQGYVRVDLSPTHADVDYVAVSTVTKPDFTTSLVRQERVEAVEGSIGFTPR